jgi:Fibronectin type III domain
MIMGKPKIKLGLNNLALDAQIAHVQSVIEAISESTTLGGAVSTANLEVILGELIAARTDRDAAKAAAKAKTPIIGDKRIAMKEELENVVDDVEDIANGNISIMESAGFDTYVPGTSPSLETLGQVLALSAIPGVADGTIVLNWAPVHGAKSYHVYIGNDPNDLDSYTTAVVVTASETTLIGLIKGNNYWIRVSAVGADGEGPKSDPASSVAR